MQNIIMLSSAPTIHLMCIVTSSNKAEFTFTGLPNPYNRFNHTSNFPVTILLTSKRWNDNTKRTLTPSKGAVVKITGTISSVHPDDNGVNHWVISASKIFFIKDMLSVTKPTAPGTGKTLLYYVKFSSSDNASPVKAQKPGKAFSYATMSLTTKRLRSRIRLIFTILLCFEARNLSFDHNIQI